MTRREEIIKLLNENIIKMANEGRLDIVDSLQRIKQLF